MAVVGIIANPASGKDIRRLVTQALVVGNRQKTGIVRSILVGLHAAGIRDVRVMPDLFGIGRQAIHDLHSQWAAVTRAVSFLDMTVTDTETDTATAASMLAEAGAGCIIVLGGDGTTRTIAKSCGETPLLAVSTGTNNVVPQFVDGTIAGMAAGMIALQPVNMRKELCCRSKRLDILIDGKVVDTALVDVGAVAGNFTGTRAIWDTSNLRQIAVSRASPSSIGLSSVLGMIQTVSPYEQFGLIATIGDNGLGWKVIAPVGPGLVSSVPIQEVRVLAPEQPQAIHSERPLVLALDGERVIRLREGEEATVVLETAGPWIVQVERVMEWATRERCFIQ
jgi:predicted polyphosphate/ATP-dependent NAD kinase